MPRTAKALRRSVVRILPGDYSLNLAANTALSTGAQLGDIERACSTLREKLSERDMSQDERTRLMAEGCAEVAEELSRQAEDDRKADRKLSASDSSCVPVCCCRWPNAPSPTGGPAGRRCTHGSSTRFGTQSYAAGPIVSSSRSRTLLSDRRSQDS